MHVARSHTDPPSARHRTKRRCVGVAQALLTPALLRSAVVGHGDALRPHYATQLEICSALLRQTSASVRRSGGLLFGLLFEEFTEPCERQVHYPFVGGDTVGSYNPPR